MFCEFVIWSWEKSFWSKKKESIFGWRGCLCLFKSFVVWSFLLWTVIKIGSFSFCIRNSEYFHALPAWLEIQTLPCPWLWIWLNCWNRCQQQLRSHQEIRKFFSYQNDQNEASFVIIFSPTVQRTSIRAERSMFHGRHAAERSLGFGWATFKGVGCIIDTFVTLV